ncbi:MAG: tetratricopeptide repeat protein [Acidobacteriota bacterium]|nr:tetratricopeptide repeat protein [Acidobacteriota bacterium]
MAFNKKTALEEAAKLVSQRKIPQAIKTYQVISEHDPQDLALLNIIGDLCVREGNTREALRHFRKLADAYTSEGFTLKAIAIFKKIVKLDSESVDALVRLADLYAAQKLSHEASEQFAQALALCQRKSLHDKEGQILKKLVSQDPANTAYRLKLADHLRAAGKLPESSNEYLEAARTFYLQKNQLAASAALKKAAETGPDSPEIALWQARLAAESGRFEEAQQIINRSPEVKASAGGLSLLMTALLGSGQLEKASSLAIDACRDSPDGPALAGDYMAHCLKSGEHGAVLRVLEGIAGMVPEKVKPRELAGLVREAMDGRPPDLTTLDRLSDLCERIWGGETPSETLEALGKAYGAAGEWIKSRAIIERLCARDESNEIWHSLLEESKAAGRAGENTGAQPPVNEPLAASGGAGSTVGDKRGRQEEGPTADSTAAAQNLTGLDLDFSAEWATYASAHAAELPIPADAGQVIPDAEEGKTEIEFYLDHGLLAEAGAALDQFSTKFPGHPHTVELRDRLALLTASPKDVAEAPFLAADEATIDRPPSLALAQSHEALGSEEQMASEQPACGAVNEQASQPQTPEPALTTPSLRTSEEAIASSAPNDESPLNDLARDLEMSLGPAETQTGSGPEAPSAQSGAATGSTPVPALEDDETSLNRSAETTASVPQSITESGASFFGSSLEELLSELNAGEESAPADDTPQTHYNLGIAFREMGLLDEAIGEFQKVVKAASGAGSSPRLLEACSMLGICFMEKEMPEIAIRWLMRALESPGLDEDTTLALTYDLATACEQSGDRKTALEKFSEVYSVNIDYRDVADRIQSLQAKHA